MRSLHVLSGSFVALVLLGSLIALSSPPESASFPVYVRVIDDPLLRWDMESLSGTGEMLDLSGNGNDGTITGAAEVSGMFGQAYSFDGTNDYMEAADSASLDISSDLAISVFLKHAAGVGNGRIIGKLNSDFASEWNYAIIITGQRYDVCWATSDGNGYKCWQADFAVASGTWYHVVAIIDAPNALLYVDGVSKTMSDTLGGTGTSNPVSNARPFRLGQSAGNWWNGTIDEVYLFDHNLTTEDIATLGDGGVPPANLEVETLAATDILHHTATLNGNLSSFPSPIFEPSGIVHIFFQWGTSPVSFAEETDGVWVNSTQLFEQFLYELDDGKIYYFRAVGEGNTTGQVFGVTLSFTTIGEVVQDMTLIWILIFAIVFLTALGIIPSIEFGGIFWIVAGIAGVLLALEVFNVTADSLVAAVVGFIGILLLLAGIARAFQMEV